MFNPLIGQPEYPGDILLIRHEGVTDYPAGAVSIIIRDTTSITVALTQTYTSPSSNIDKLYYQFKTKVFDKNCYEEGNLYGEDDSLDEITIDCRRHSKIAVLEVWMAYDISKGMLSGGDYTIIHNCCYPTFYIIPLIIKNVTTIHNFIYCILH